MWLANLNSYYMMLAHSHHVLGKVFEQPLRFPRELLDGLAKLSCEAHLFCQDIHMKTVFEQQPPQFNEFVTSVSEKMLIHSHAPRVLGLKALYMPVSRKT